jgi:hypothetical protein
MKLVQIVLSSAQDVGHEVAENDPSSADMDDRVPPSW